eukprot:TRINITY_DN1999_c0_g2_i7.p1 TRINITY_DN1999_c0_g2~~TRINITY_DN1999_c0_g2_i7.p1  ORF type:complete len:448 (+),score=162.14 TRINITY_DN1999_c0_g2_i7:70-1344(+)
MSNNETKIGLYGLGVMGQNLALNFADKGFPISVCNRSSGKVDTTVKLAGDLPVTGYYDMSEFVQSISKPRTVIIMVTAGKAVDATIEALTQLLEPGDSIVDAGNEWYENTERREKQVAEFGLNYMGMGVSGGEEGARYGPSMMPGGSLDTYNNIADMLNKVAAVVDDVPCVTYIGKGGAGNYVKTVHNGIEYGDMQLITETYDILKQLGQLDNEKLSEVFTDWNKGELQSFLIEITADICAQKDTEEIQGGGDGTGYLLDSIMDKCGMKGTGMWTVKEAATQHVSAPTIAAALDSRYISGIKEERVAASEILSGPEITPVDDVPSLIEDVRSALYFSKICAYAQGMNLIKAAGEANDWDLDLGKIATIWKGGCIIRAAFLDRIKEAYERDASLASLLVDAEFSKEVIERQAAMRRVVSLAVSQG